MTEFLVYRAGVILAAVALDRLLGEPRWLPHPIRMIGFLIRTGEKLRVLPLPLKLSGTLMAAGVVALTGVSVWGLLYFTYQSLWWGLAVETLLVYLAIAPRGLADEALAVDSRLRRDDLPGARARLAMIVGRDTGSLDEQEVRRAAVETVSENTVDGVFCPLFYTVLFGAMGAWMYKAVSTLDSMVGYRNERYRQFGWAGARLDDAAAFIPARLALLLIPAAAKAAGLSARQAWRVGWRDRLAHSSPNAGHGEALYAGALGVRLGGRSSYGGVVSEKSYLGGEFAPPGPETIRQSVALLWWATWLLALSAAVLLSAIGLAGLQMG
ncbi:MAG: adenosylcobinamide-phosphate synthase CbiB [Clostridia bacterium]|nr:adenosylcobinamide-phosphate synthase CbiB [Clostridia bacterium]